MSDEFDMSDKAAAAAAAAVPDWLAIDVGNSRVKFGLFKAAQDFSEAADLSETRPAVGAGIRRLPECLKLLTVPLSSAIPWQELAAALAGAEVRSAMIGSNQNGVSRVLAEWPPQLGRPPQTFRDSTDFPIAIDVEQPRRVGLDRLLTAVAANVIRPANREVVIVDCGTATTVDRLDARGTFSGGAILPGFELSAIALNQYTEALPLIPIEAIVGVDAKTGGHAALGRNTRDAIMSGIFWGQIGAIRELIQRLSDPGALILLAGGGSQLLVPHFPEASYYPYLALQGIVEVATLATVGSRTAKTRTADS